MVDHHCQLRPFSDNFGQIDIFPSVDGDLQPVQRVGKPVLFEHRGSAAQAVQRGDNVGLFSSDHKRLHPGHSLGKRHHESQKSLIAQCRTQPVQCHQLCSPE